MHEARIRARARALPPAFLQEIGRPDLSPVEVHAAVAGLIVLRVIDRWVAAGCRPAGELSGARAAVEGMDVGNPARAILGALLDAVAAGGSDGAQDGVRQLMAYGRHLEFEAKWELALDVYRVVVDYGAVASSSETVCDAWLRSGSCCRTQGNYDAAQAAYGEAARLAALSGDLERTLRAELGPALIARAHGSLDEADRLLAAIATSADAAGLNAVLSQVLHDRAVIAAMRGAPVVAAVQLAFRALDLSPTSAERDQILYDIGETLRVAGMRSAARDAFLVISCTAESRTVRCWAGIMLMRIAADDGARENFQQYRRALDHTQFSPELRIEYYIQSGYSLRALGDLPGSEAALREAVQCAEQHGHVQQLMVARQAVAGAADAAPAPAPEDLDGLLAVIDALRLMRETAVPG